jgi:hypothetical protein
MKIVSDFTKISLTLIDGKIASIKDEAKNSPIKTFPRQLTKKNCGKIYVIKEDNFYLYVGTTMQSITSRLRYGLTANGKYGYYGYKWKNKEKVAL